MARKILIVGNRRKLVGRKRELLQDVMAGLARLGHDVTLCEVTPAAGCLDLDSAIDASQADQIVVAGGDGTLNRMLQYWPHPEIPLALVPLGTLNLVAAECGYPRDALGLTRLIDANRWRRFYTAVAGTEVFAIGAGCGIDSFVMGSVDPRAKQRWGRPYLVWKLASALGRYPWPDFDVRVDGVAVPGTSVCLVKGRYYGGPFRFTGHSSMFDPSLHVAVAGRDVARRVVGIGAFLCGARTLVSKMFSVRRAAEIEIRSPSSFPFHVDGDVRLALPVRITLQDRPFRICVP